MESQKNQGPYSPPLSQGPQFQFQQIQQPQQLQTIQKTQQIPSMQQILPPTDSKKRRYHQLTEYEKAKINFLKGSGRNITEIANELGISRTSINYYIKKISNPNCTYGKTGRPRKQKNEMERAKEPKKTKKFISSTQINIPQPPQPPIPQANYIQQQSNINLYQTPSNTIRLNALNDGNVFPDTQSQLHDFSWKSPSNQQIFKQNTGFRPMYES